MILCKEPLPELLKVAAVPIDGRMVRLCLYPTWAQCFVLSHGTLYIHAFPPVSSGYSKGFGRLLRSHSGME